jgi:hypothetical protein
MIQQRIDASECRINPFLLVLLAAAKELIPPEIRNLRVVADIADNMVSEILVARVEKHRHIRKRVLVIFDKRP